jgi:ATP-dependent Lon protease
MAEALRKDEDPPKIPEVLPVLPLRDIVIFPFMIVPLYASGPSRPSTRPWPRTA